MTRSRVILYSWCASIVVLACIAAGLWIVGRPCLSVRNSILDLKTGAVSTEECVQQLGGPPGAVDSIRTYLLVWPGSEDERAAAVEILGACGKSAATEIAYCMQDEQQLVRETAIAELRALKKDAVPELLKALRSQNPMMRTGAALALNTCSDPRAIDALIEILDDSDASVCAAAAIALVEIGAQAVPALLKTARTSSGRSRTQAYKVLKKLNSLKGHRMLADGLADSDVEVRTVSAAAVGELGARGTRHVGRLAELLNDKDEGVRMEAAHAMGQVAQKPSVSVPALMGALNDSSVGVRSNAAGSLGSFGAGASSSVSSLIEATGDADQLVRSNAGDSLVEIAMESPRALSMIKQAAISEGPRIRQAAREALEKIKKAQEEKKAKQPVEAPEK